jgi:uncharacterized membrane protein
MPGKDRLNRALAALRALGVAACLLALLDVGLPVPSSRRVTYFLFDVSDSVGRAGVEESRRSALGLLRSLPDSDMVGIVAFARTPALVSRPMPARRMASVLEDCPLESSDPGSTDMSLALSFVSALLKGEKGDKGTVIFGDGRSTLGAAVDAQALTRHGLRVWAYPVGGSSGGVVSRSLEPPDLSRAGGKAILRWRIFTDRDISIRYTVKVDGVAVQKGAADLRKGEREIEVAVDAGAPGARTVEIDARDEQGRVLPLAACGALLGVEGDRRVLVVRGGKAPSPLSSALALQGIKTLDAGVDALPESAPGYSGYTAVVLDDVSAVSMTESRQRALVDFVSGGGGLLVVGGYSSLGRGEYYSTVLEDVLPVETDTRQRLFFSRATILFVIDHSGSMSEMVGGTSKQLAAMQGVAASIPELNPQDEVGILSFDTSPTWVLPFTPVSQAIDVQKAFSSIPEGGGTDMSTAIQEVVRGFGEAGPNKRHAVILSDGFTVNADFRALSDQLKLYGISVSTIGIGDTVNEELLKEVAEWNDGAYYRAVLGDIPKVIKKETVRVTRDLIQEGRFSARAVGRSPAIQGLESDLPRYSGYLITKPKALANVILETSGGDAKQADPLLAEWRYGNGSVCVFSSDSGARWLGAWAGSLAYKRLWAQTVRSIERPGIDSGLQARAAQEAGKVRVTVEALDPDGRASTGRSLSAIGDSGGSAPVRLEETAPGHYEALMDSGGGGLRTFRIQDSHGKGWTQAWLWNPGGAELASSGPDIASLASIAEANGGSVLGASGLSLPKPAPAWLFLSARIPLIAAALALLLAELYCRSALFGQLAMALAALSAWFKRQAGFMEEIERKGVEESLSAPWSPDDSRKAMEAYRRLAERARERAAARGSKDED